jgi:hypothetical protein
MALLVLALMLVVMMAFAGLALAKPTQPPAGRGCIGIETARGVSAGRQGPPEGKGPPPFTDDLPAANVPPFGGRD